MPTIDVNIRAPRGRRIIQRKSRVEMHIGNDYYAIAREGERWVIFQLMAGGFTFIFGFPTFEEAQAKLLAMRVLHG